MPPDAAEVRERLRKAEGDRITAEAALAHHTPVTFTAAFHAQQSVEKLLKAYLTHLEEPFEKTHDLRSLVETCAGRDAAILALQDRLEPLTAYAVRFRYPGPADPTVDEVRAALVVVDDVRRFVISRLPAESQSGPVGEQAR